MSKQGRGLVRDDATVTAASPLTRRVVPWSRLAVTAVFVAHGLLFASWTAHIPNVKSALGLSDGTLGFALLGAPVGSVCAMALASYLLPRTGSRAVVQVALIGYCLTGPLVGIVGNLPALMGALLVWGAFQGSLDVAMNTQAIAVERSTGQMLMSGLHGSWSIGSFAGAGLGAAAVGKGITLTPQLLALGTIALAVAGLLTVRMLSDEARVQDADDTTTVVTPGSRWSGGMMLLGAIAFASMLCEGATADWASVYLSGPLHAAGIVPGLGYATFAAAMLTVRLVGNRLLARYRLDRLLPILATVATVGLAVALLLRTTFAALIGFGCLGVGLASIVPAVFSAAGRIESLHAGTAVATVSAFGWAGFVVGPPVIGRLAALTSLPLALGLLPLLGTGVIVGTAMAPALKPATVNDQHAYVERVAAR